MNKLEAVEGHLQKGQLYWWEPSPARKRRQRLACPKGAEGGRTRLNAAPPYGAPLKGALPAERHARGPDGQGMRSPQPWALARPAPSTEGHAGAALARG